MKHLVDGAMQYSHAEADILQPHSFRMTAVCASRDIRLPESFHSFQTFLWLMFSQWDAACAVDDSKLCELSRGKSIGIRIAVFQPLV